MRNREMKIIKNKKPLYWKYTNELDRQSVMEKEFKELENLNEAKKKIQK